MSQAAMVLAHAGAHGEQGGGSALAVGIVVVLVVGWASLAALAWVFYAAKKREDLRAKEQSADAPAGMAAPWPPLDAGSPEPPGPSGGQSPPPAGTGQAAPGDSGEAGAPTTERPTGRRRP